MIGLRRSRVSLPTLRGKGADESKSHVVKREANAAAELEFPPLWGKADVRGALLAMQGWVCAYCQRKIDPRDGGHVDHFRPKRGSLPSDGYFWLAYSFDNYFLSCPRCNERKGDRFELEPSATRVTYATREEEQDEARLLASPSADPIDEWMRVETEDGSPNYANVVGRQLAAGSIPARRTEHTIDFFKLNDDVDHVQDRVRQMDRLTKKLRKGKSDKLREMASRYRPHSLTARSFLETYAPSVLPSTTADFAQYLERLCKRLLDIRYLLTRRAPSAPDSCRRAEREVAWALAVLWKDPPTGTPEEVVEVLERMGCRRRVERYYNRLLVDPLTPPATP